MIFLYYWYMKHGEKIGLKYTQGTKQQNLSTEIIADISIIIPSLQEQEKYQIY